MSTGMTGCNIIVIYIAINMTLMLLNNLVNKNIRILPDLALGFIFQTLPIKHHNFISHSYQRIYQKLIREAVETYDTHNAMQSVEY